MRIPKRAFHYFSVSCAGLALLSALGTSILGLTTGLLAADNKAAPVKKPVLKVDDSSIDEPKSAVVTSYADILENIRPAVVSVYSSKIVRRRGPDHIGPSLGDVPEQQQRQRELGSGVIMSTDGFIITNSHVVEAADELKVVLNDEREFAARIMGADSETGMAVIKIKAENLPTATLADSAGLRVGDVVFAIGNPLGVGQTVTMGTVSATGRHVGLLDEVAGYEDFIQTDVAINQGNSGGALIDARGRLVGINSASVSTSQGNVGIGFAIPINLASRIMRSLIDTGTVARLGPKSALAHLNRGVAKANGGDRAGAIADYTEAIRLYTEAIRLDPKNALAYHNRGLAKANRGLGKANSGDRAGAIADYTEAIRLNPNNFMAYANRAAARDQLGDKSGAAQDRAASAKIQEQLVLAEFQEKAAKASLFDLLVSSDKTESIARERNRALVAAKNQQLPAILRDRKTDELSALVVKIEQTILDLNHESEVAKDRAQQATATNSNARQIEDLRGLAISYRERIELLKPILTALKEEIANRNR